MTDYVFVLLHHVPAWWRMEVSKHQCLEKKKTTLYFSVFSLGSTWTICTFCMEDEKGGPIDRERTMIYFYNPVTWVAGWNLLHLMTLFLFKCTFSRLTLGDWNAFYILWLCTSLSECDCVVTCSASLMISGIATALMDALLFYNIREVTDIARSPLNLNKAPVYE